MVWCGQLVDMAEERRTELEPFQAQNRCEYGLRTSKSIGTKVLGTFRQLEDDLGVRIHCASFDALLEPTFPDAQKYYNSLSLSR